MRLSAQSCGWTLAVAAMAAMSACGAGTPRPGPADLALVTQRLDSELNAPAEYLHRNLVLANRDGRIFADELVVPRQGAVSPVDWWIFDRGYLKLAGVDRTYSLPYFTLTPQGKAFAEAGPPKWLASAIQGEPELSCSGSRNGANCQVSGIATVSATSEGAGFLNGMTFAPLPFQASLAYGPRGWRVSDFTASSDPPVAEKARTAVFGERDSVFQAHYRFAEEVGKQLR